MSLKPPGFTVPRCEWSPCPTPAGPSPKPALATVPCTPRAPPVPFPFPGPDGMSNAPTLATVNDRLLSDVPLTPFGSPKPPVCTSRAGLLMVGAAELPEAKLSVTTSRSFFGGSGLAGTGTASNDPVATSLFGSGLGSILGSGFGGAGSGAFATSGGGVLIFGGSGVGGGSVTFGGCNAARTLG